MKLVPKMRKADVFLMLWVLSYVHTSRAVPLGNTPTKNEPGDQLPYVQTVQEVKLRQKNESCLYDTFYEAPSGTCPAGYRKDNEQCAVCELSNTFQPAMTTCVKCIKCRNCADYGLVMRSPCSLTNDTDCIAATTIPLSTTRASTTLYETDTLELGHTTLKGPATSTNNPYAAMEGHLNTTEFNVTPGEVPIPFHTRFSFWFGMAALLVLTHVVVFAAGRFLGGIRTSIIIIQPAYHQVSAPVTTETQV